GLPPELGHVRPRLPVEHDVSGSPRVRPLAQVLAIRAEDLDPVVLAIADEHAAVHVHGDTMGQEELARALPWRAPRAPELAVWPELVHAAVAISVGDVQIARGRPRDVRRPVERLAGPRHRACVLAVIARVRRLIHRAEREQELAGRRELSHRVIAVVRAVHRVVRADADAVRPVGELALAPGTE